MLSRGFFYGLFMTPDRRDEDHWRIDKRINVSMVASLLVFVATLIWWAAGVESRFLVITENRSADQLKTDLQIQMINADLKAASKRTEYQVETINKNLDQMKISVEKLSDKIEKLN